MLVKLWSLTLREKCRVRGFENRVLRRIFGPKREEVAGEWGRLAAYVAPIGEGELYTEFSLGKKPTWKTLTQMKDYMY
jgi:hypothetical protein